MLSISSTDVLKMPTPDTPKYPSNPPVETKMKRQREEYKKKLRILYPTTEREVQILTSKRHNIQDNFVRAPRGGV